MAPEEKLPLGRMDQPLCSQVNRTIIAIQQLRWLLAEAKAEGVGTADLRICLVKSGCAHVDPEKLIAARTICEAMICFAPGATQLN